MLATVGTTSSNAIDPVRAIGEICREHNLWLHVDGAYGAAAALSARGREALQGLDLADSITLDPHKWLFQPFEIGCVLVRDMRHLHAAFAVHPEDQASYLEDVGRIAEREVVFYEHGPQLTRSFRALKLWMSLRVYGVRAFRETIDRGIALAEEAERVLRDDPRWEVVTPAQLAVVTFAPARPEISLESRNALVQRAVEQLVADGFAMVTSTQIGGRVVLRFDFEPLASDRVRLYFDPVGPLEPRAANAQVSVHASDLYFDHQGAFTQFTFSGPAHLPGAIDEIRWATTWADAVPLPEPGFTVATLLGVATGAGCVALSRRRRRLRRARQAVKAGITAS